jgi:hypothetical protein
MPDSLLFDGIDDRITFTMGSLLFTGAWTFGYVLKKTSTGESNYGLDVYGTNRRAIGTDNNGRAFVSGIYMQGAGGDPILLSSDGWGIMVCRKAAGTVVPTFSLYKFDSNVWAHSTSTAAATFANSSALANIYVGNIQEGTIPFEGNILIAGFWDSQLSQASIETLKNGTQTWIDLAPQELLRLNTTSSITATVGTSTESARTGTTLDAGDAPAGWADVAAPATGTGPRNVLMVGVG